MLYTCTWDLGNRDHPPSHRHTVYEGRSEGTQDKPAVMRSISCPVPRTRQRKLPLLISRDAIRYYRISHPSFYRPQPPSTRLNRRSSYLQQFKSSPSAHPLPHRTEADQSMVRQNQYTPPRDTFDMEQQTRQQSHQQSYRYQQPPPQSSPPSSSPPPSSSSPPPSSPPSTTTSFPHPPQHQKKGRPVLSKSVHPFDAHRSPSQKQRGLRNANGRFVFYDIETTGLNPKFDQILQFSAVLLDAEFNELDRVDVRSRLMKHVIPSPTALFVTNRSLGQIRDGDCMSQHELVSSLHKTLSEWSPAYFIG